MLAQIQSLRLRALALRSSIHNEHMLSAIELSGMTAKKTNEIIDVVNELCNVVEELEKEVQSVVYDETSENLSVL